jgi:hypothetical protein
VSSRPAWVTQHDFGSKNKKKEKRKHDSSRMFDHGLEVWPKWWSTCLTNYRDPGFNPQHHKKKKKILNSSRKDITIYTHLQFNVIHLKIILKSSYVSGIRPI